MPTLNFQTRFAELVKNGTKRQTIRKVGKRFVCPGDILYLYTGQRTKECQRLGSVICKGVQRLRIYTGHELGCVHTNRENVILQRWKSANPNINR
jgi:hypothetical protein